MKPTVQQEKIRAAGDFVPATVHYSRRSFDKKFEVVATLRPEVLAHLELNIGGEVVLDIAEDRNQALELVRFYRGHKSGDSNNG